MKLKEVDDYKYNPDYKARARENIRSIVDPTIEFLYGVRTFLIEFCDNSNIHGVRYFTERRLHWSERVWWLSFFSVSFYLCVTFILGTWINWNEHPVTISFTEKERPISAIPFPTVTICPETKAPKHVFDVTKHINDYLDSNSNLTDTDMVRLEALSQICNLIPELLDYEKRTDLDPFINETMYQTLAEMAPTMNDSFNQCWWQSKMENCSSLIGPVMTEEGLCYSFNALNSHDIYTEHMAPGFMSVKDNLNKSHWSLELGYGDGSLDTEYPIRVVDSGRSAALDISLWLNETDFEYQCRGFDQGYRVVLTLPGEVLRMSRSSFRVPVAEDTLITVKAKMTITSRGLRSYGSKLRQCFFAHEKTLHFYKLYTQRNCEDECLANFTKIECGCVRFSMPRDKDTPICGSGSVKCYKAAERKISTQRYAREFRQKCNCLTTCTTVDYSADIDRVKFDMATVNKTELNETGIKQARLAIFFRDQQVETIKRMEVYTYSDFLALCGGLLGLFLGMSVLSVIEFIYFGTLRWYWAARREREQNATQQIEHQKVVSVIPIDKVD